MADERELKQEFTGVVEGLRAENEASLKNLKGIGERTAETKQVMARMQDDLVKLSRQIDEAAAKANRPDAAKAEHDEVQRKGLVEYLRKGDYQISGDSGGGYTVPDLIADQIIGLMRTYNPVRQFARTLTVSSGSPLYIPRVTTNQTGGFVAETATRAASSAAVFEQRAITPHAVAVNITATNALLQDSAFDMEQWIVDEAAKSFAQYEGTAFITGDGNGQPYGIMADAGVLANYLTTAADDAIGADDFVKLPFEIATQYNINPNTCAYIMNRTTMAAAMVLKTGALGAIGGYYFHPSPSDSFPWRLNGYPVVLMDSMADVASGAYPVAFGDLSQYWIADTSGGWNVVRDPFTSKGNVVFHIERRVGGNVADPDAFAVMVVQ